MHSIVIKYGLSFYQPTAVEFNTEKVTFEEIILC